ncbi:MAG: ComEC/Rec2 family competence protein [Bacteroidia bacterium]|nr:ComEC/Rec2 family competence protein [Bacteroidia bacterium]
MTFWEQTPFVKLLIPFIAGIISAYYFDFNENNATYLVVFILILLSSFLFLYRHLKSYRFSSLAIVVFYIFGFVSTYLSNPNNRNNNISRLGKSGVFLLKVDEIPQIKRHSIKFNSIVLKKYNRNRKTWVKVNEKVVCYKTKKSKIPILGDIILTNCDFKKINESENPYQFNYQKFLEKQGIFHTVFLHDEKIRKYKNDAGFIDKLSFKGVEFLKNVLRKSIKDSVSLGVTEALIFGYKEDLPKELVESYSKTGTLHVLAVSGMHVALVFLLLSKLLWFMDINKFGKIIKPVFLIISIWVYCIITGMSPSVIRAGVMISLIIIAKILSKNINIYNIIFASALIILLINPMWLFNVGFQLSFAAVVGIVFFQKYFKNIWTPQNKIIEVIWEIVIVSISAQLAAFPLCLHYFNQFPNYFILSNLIIIPLTTIIIYVGSLLVIFYNFLAIQEFLSDVVTFLVKLTNNCVVKIENLPYSYLDGIKLTAFQTVLLYAVIFLFLYWLIKNDKKVFVSMIILIILLLSLQMIDKLKLQNEKTIVLFNIPSNNAILLSDGRNSVVLTDKEYNSNLLFYIRGYLIEKRIFPIKKLIKINELNEINYKNEKMNLKIRNSKIVFRNYRLKISNELFTDNNYNLNYIIPDKDFLKFDLCNLNDTNLKFGQSQDKWLQRKIEKKLGNCHNNAIKNLIRKKFELIKVL